jgi:hypothetical protein
MVTSRVSAVKRSRAETRPPRGGAGGERLWSRDAGHSTQIYTPAPGPTVSTAKAPLMRPDELERRLRERLDALGPGSPRRTAPRPHAARLRPRPTGSESSGATRESRPRRAPDRERGGPDAPGGARGDAAGRRQVGGEARTSDLGFRFLLRRRLPLPPRARRPRSPLQVHGRYCP